MAEVCPTITAYSIEEYRRQMEKIAPFANRIQIDLTDGKFTKQKTVGPEDAWWPAGVKADFHLMYKDPMAALEVILKHKPNLVIMHAEAEGNFESFRHYCQKSGTKVGIALLPKTGPESIEPALQRINHVLIFSGNLGYQGGSHANLELLKKVKYLKNLRPDLEVGWDGGVNQNNISQLVFGGVDVFNVGGAIQSAEDPEQMFRSLSRIAEETGTT